jgi:hypothetical protein
MSLSLYIFDEASYLEYTGLPDSRGDVGYPLALRIVELGEIDLLTIRQGIGQHG